MRSLFTRIGNRAPLAVLASLGIIGVVVLIIQSGSGSKDLPGGGYPPARNNCVKWSISLVRKLSGNRALFSIKEGSEAEILSLIGEGLEERGAPLEEVDEVASIVREGFDQLHRYLFFEDMEFYEAMATVSNEIRRACTIRFGGPTTPP